MRTLMEKIWPKRMRGKLRGALLMCLASLVTYIAVTNVGGGDSGVNSLMVTMCIVGPLLFILGCALLVKDIWR